MSLDLTKLETKSKKKVEKYPWDDFKLPNFQKKLSSKNKEQFYRELNLLLKSGVDFKKALEILIKQNTKSNNKILIEQIKDKIVEGKPVYETLKETKLFSSYEYYSIQIGEETRKLENVLDELQLFFKKKIELKRQLVSVFTYPVLVIVVTLGVLYFMLTKVVPMFSNVFKQFGSELPKSTKIILKISENSGIIITLICLFIAVIASIHFIYKNNETYKKLTSNYILKLPFVGDLVRNIYLSRFCQSMKLLISSKTTLITTLELTGKMISFYPLEMAIKQIKVDIIAGYRLTESLQKHKIFDDRLISMIEVAEQVNQLDHMFEKLTEQYNDEIAHKTKMIGVVLEPLIIIIIGVIVGGVMISMYAPMFDLSKIIK